MWRDQHHHHQRINAPTQPTHARPSLFFHPATRCSARGSDAGDCRTAAWPREPLGPLRFFSRTARLARLYFRPGAREITNRNTAAKAGLAHQKRGAGKNASSCMANRSTDADVPFFLILLAAVPAQTAPRLSSACELRQTAPRNATQRPAASDGSRSEETETPPQDRRHNIIADVPTGSGAPARCAARCHYLPRLRREVLVCGDTQVPLYARPLAPLYCHRSPRRR